MADRVEIPLSHGLMLVAERNCDPDYDRELYVGIVDSAGAWIQDIVCVQNAYRYKNDGQLDWLDDTFKVILWGDAETDDFTQEFDIPLRSDL